MRSPVSEAEWHEAVGYLPPLLNRLARDLAAERGVSPANAVTEALVTVRDLAKSGRTHERDLRVRQDVLAVLHETLDEWEFQRALALSPLPAEDEQSILDLIARDVREAERVITESGEVPLGDVRPEAIAATLSLVEVESSSYPDLPNKPGKTNWVEKAGGLPHYIERVAKHLVHERGYTVSRAIATAVSQTKKMCSTGRAFGGKTPVGAKARAVACNAVKEWERKRGAGKAREGLVRSVDSLQHIVTPMHGQARFAERYAHRVSVIEGLLSGLAQARDPQLAIRSAESFLGERAFPDDFGFPDAIGEADLSEPGRKKMAGKGQALSDGSYPIPNKDYLRRAIQAFGRAKDKAKAKAHIISRAKALGATALLPDGWDVRESSLYVSELLEAELVLDRSLMEALGYGTTPKRATEPGHKGQFHGMHGVERAVRRRTEIPTGPREEGELLFGKEREAADAAAAGAQEAAPWSEGLHPRANGGQFSTKDGGGQDVHPSVQQQLDERLTELGYQGGAKSLREFQQANGLPATGRIDQPTTDALRVADPVDQVRKQTAASIEYGRAHRAGVAATVQKTQVAADQIQAVGYPDSPAGISQFQKDYGLPVNGKLDEKTLATISTVYSNNSRASNAKPDINQIAGGGIRVKSRAATAASKSKGSGKGTPAPSGRKTVGKSRIHASLDELFEPGDERSLVEANLTGFGQMFDASLYGGPVARVIVGEPTSTNHAIDSTFARERERQPGGDDIDLDEPWEMPPGWREGSGTQVCQTCPHFSKKGRMGYHIGACMLHTWPVERLDVCDDWTTLSPEDTAVKVWEARLAEAERANDTDAVVSGRAQLAAARRRLEEAGVPPHPADREHAGLTVEEATFDPAKHPRGRGGKWARAAAEAIKAFGFQPNEHGSHALNRAAHRFEQGTHTEEDIRHASQLAGSVRPEDHASRPEARAHVQHHKDQLTTAVAKLSGGKGSRGVSSDRSRAATGRAQQDAQDRHRRLHNERVAKDESGLNTSHLKIKMGHPDLHGNAAVMDGDQRVGQLQHVGDGWDAHAGTSHPTNDTFLGHFSTTKDAAEAILKHNAKAKKPGSKMSRRSGHDLLNEVADALKREGLSEGQVEFLTLQQLALEEGRDPDEHLGVYLEVLSEELAAA